jgi:hypothetical protein
MAYGDAMRFVSEELGVNGTFETFDTGLAVGWTEVDTGSKITPSSDNTEQRSGTYCQKLAFSGTGEGGISQVYTLPLRDDCVHKAVGASFNFKIYGKVSALSGGDDIFRVKITELDANDVAGTSEYSTEVDISTSYQLATLTHVIADSDCKKIKVEVALNIGGAISVYLDDASTTFDYTVATNPTGAGGLDYEPSLPESSEVSINNVYYRQRNSSTEEKYRKVRLNFGVCTTAQKNALSLMTKIDKAFTWYPYNPDLPTSLEGYFKSAPMPKPLVLNWGRYSLTLNFDER